MPVSQTGGFSIANIADAKATHNRIIQWINENGDRVVAIDYNLGRYISFKDRNFAGQIEPTEPAGGWVAVAYDPPAEGLVAQRNEGVHTNFDDHPLSSRSAHYQQLAVDYFADFVLSQDLRPRGYIVTPTNEVTRILGGKLPTNAKDLVTLISNGAPFLDLVQCVEGEFDPRTLSLDSRKVIRALLEDSEQVSSYLREPRAFIERVLDYSPPSQETDTGKRQELNSLAFRHEGTPRPGLQERLTEREAAALLRGAQERPEMVRMAFDAVELGGAGQTYSDNDTYVLVGADSKTGRPDPAALTWFVSQLPRFVELNGFVPGFGVYVTEARSRTRIVLGPGVTERTHRFLQLHGHQLVDMTDGRPFELPLDQPSKKDDTTSSDEPSA